MQQLLFVCFLLLTASLLRAGDLPRLNLEVGKKYSIETIYHEDTSKVNPHREYDKKIFEFTPTGFDKDKGIYDVKLVITYFMYVVQEIPQPGIWSEKEVYETGFPSNFRRPVVFMNKHQVPFTFKLSTEGEITTFDFSAYYNYKKMGDLEPDLGEWDQKEIEAEICTLFFNPAKIQVDWPPHFAGDRSDYKIIREIPNSVEVEIKNSGNRVSRDTRSPRNKFTNTSDQFKRKMVIDKITGLILEEKLSYLWNFLGKKPITRYQKWIPVFSNKFEAYQKTAESNYIKTTIPNTNTTIKVTVQDSTEYPEFLYLTYLDLLTNSYQSYRLKKGRNGAFDFQIHLDQPTEVYLHDNPELHINIKAELVYLWPGNQLEVEIRKASESNRIIFNGIGAEENRLKLAMRKLRTSPGKFQFFFSNASKPRCQDSAYQILNQYKLSIDPELYLEMGNTLLYEKYLSKQTSLSDSINDIKIPVCNTLAAKN